MRRHEFITLIGSASVAWSLAARAQEPKRRIGMLMSLLENDPEGEPHVRAFVDGLQRLGWTVGHNVRVDIRWAGDPADTGKYAAELVALAPDVIFASASANVAALQRIPEASCRRSRFFTCRRDWPICRDPGSNPRACCLVLQRLLESPDLFTIKLRQIGVDNDFHIVLLGRQISIDVSLASLQAPQLIAHRARVSVAPCDEVEAAFDAAPDILELF
jgi:hypothetical protein